MNRRSIPDYSLLIGAAALFAMNSPLTQWWTALDLPWFAMFLPWSLIIGLVWLNQRQRSD